MVKSDPGQDHLQCRRVVAKIACSATITLAPVAFAAEPMWPDILQAVGTVVATSFTAVSVFLLVLDSRRRNRELRDAEAAQARLVTSRIKALTSNGQVTIEIANDSAEPIRNLEIRPTQRRDRADSGRILRSGVMRGHNVLEFEWISSTPIRPLGHPRAIEVAIEFEDAKGFVWKRVDNGTPERIIVTADNANRHVFQRPISASPKWRQWLSPRAYRRTPR